MSTCALCGIPTDNNASTCPRCAAACFLCGHPHGIYDPCPTCGHHRKKLT